MFPTPLFFLTPPEKTRRKHRSSCQGLGKEGVQAARERGEKHDGVLHRDWYTRCCSCGEIRESE